MKNLASLSILSAFLALTSCGPSAEEVERKLLRDIAAKQKFEKELVDVEADIEKARTAISDLGAQEEVERVRLSRIEEWQFGRTVTERDAQIAEQVKHMELIATRTTEWKDFLAAKERQRENLKEMLSIYTNVDLKMKSSGVE